ncbi:hypothetical protein X801_01517, partial [Opisthorchis viverrini]
MVKRYPFPSRVYRTSFVHSSKLHQRYVLWHDICKPAKIGHLLIATIRLLDAITRGDDSLAEVWCGLDLMDAILVAQHQMRWLHGDEVEIINRLFYTFSSNITGISALIQSFDKVLPTFGIYLHKVCEDEPHLIPFSAYYNSLRAIIPVMDAVVASMPLPEAASCFSSDSTNALVSGVDEALSIFLLPHPLLSDRTVLPCLLHVTLGCQSQLNDLPIVRGILADLNILYKDVIRTIESVLRTSTSSSEDLVTLGSWYSEDLGWITSLDSNTKVDLRGAFVNCVLNDASTETRNQLLFICNRLQLSNLLESLTDRANEALANTSHTSAMLTSAKSKEFGTRFGCEANGTLPSGGVVLKVQAIIIMRDKKCSALCDGK